MWMSEISVLWEKLKVDCFTGGCHTPLIHAAIDRTLTTIWTASSEFGTYRLCEQRRFRRACASAQSRQNLRCSLIQAVSQEESSDRKPDPWPLWMAGQLKFVMTECSKTQIRLTGLILFSFPNETSSALRWSYWKNKLPAMSGRLVSCHISIQGIKFELARALPICYPACPGTVWIG